MSDNTKDVLVLAILLLAVCVWLFSTTCFMGDGTAIELSDDYLARVAALEQKVEELEKRLDVVNKEEK